MADDNELPSREERAKLDPMDPRSWVRDWIDEACVEIAGDTHCCDISSSDWSAMAAIVRRHLAEEPWHPEEHPKCPECGGRLAWHEKGMDDWGNPLGYWTCHKGHRDPRAYDPEAK